MVIHAPLTTQDLSWNSKRYSDITENSRVRPSTSTNLVFHQYATISTNTTNWGTAFPGVGLGLLPLGMDALTTWLQVCDSYGHSTVSQTPYLTHEVLPYLHFSLPPPTLDYFSQ